MPIEYQNGNYVVRILKDGTKYRFSDNPVPEIPESIDVKVTNKCDAGCKFCHEKSVPNGDSFDVDFAYKLFRELPYGVELAIGGGNPLEKRQDLIWLQRKIKALINVTINARHLYMFDNLYPNAIGISYVKELHENIKKFCKKYHFQSVIHLIAGVHTLDDLEKCLEDFDRVLILGYKKFGRGKEFYSPDVEKNLSTWKDKIGSYFHKNKDKKIIAFDNLAVDQLKISYYFTKKRWEEIYMGNDGQFSMYIDLVKKEYAKSSRSEKRYDIGNKSIKEMFSEIKNSS